MYALQCAGCSAVCCLPNMKIEQLNQDESKGFNFLFISTESCLFFQKSSDYCVNTRLWGPWRLSWGLYGRAASLLGQKIYHGVRKVYHDVRKVYHSVRKVYHGVKKVYYCVKEVYHGVRKV